MAEAQAKNTLRKEERLNSLVLIEKLFSGGSKSLSAFPLRIVYMPVAGEDYPTASYLISVPKKRFKHAVDRNRVKRQVREAIRHHKAILTDALKAGEQKAVIAFIWLDHSLHDSKTVDGRVKKLFLRVSERLVKP